MIDLTPRDREILFDEIKRLLFDPSGRRRNSTVLPLSSGSDPAEVVESPAYDLW